MGAIGQLVLRAVLPKSSSALPCAPLLTCSTPEPLPAASISDSSRLSLGGGRKKESRLQPRMADTTTQAPVAGDRAPVKSVKVVDHLVMFKMTMDEIQEKEMMDGLYSLQYMTPNVVSLSLGRLTNRTREGYTHGLFNRFNSKQALMEYWTHEKRLEVAQNLIIPYFSEPNGLCTVDFEAEVENDMEDVFRRGERFENGVEHFQIFKFKEGTSPEVIEKSLNTIKAVRAKFGDDVVQTTMGENIAPLTVLYFSHGVVTRFSSESSFAKFEDYLTSNSDWAAVKSVTENLFEGNYVVEPIGNKLM